jgi:hypothetical protein
MAETISFESELSAWATTILRAEIKADGLEAHLLQELENFPREFVLFLPVKVSMQLELDDGTSRIVHRESDDDTVTLLEQNGSEVRSVELERLTAQGIGLIERRDAFEFCRDYAAECYEAKTGSAWRPRAGSMLNHRALTSAMIEPRVHRRPPPRRDAAAMAEPASHFTKDAIYAEVNDRIVRNTVCLTGQWCLPANAKRSYRDCLSPVTTPCIRSSSIRRATSMLTLARRPIPAKQNRTLNSSVINPCSELETRGRASVDLPTHSAQNALRQHGSQATCRTRFSARNLKNITGKSFVKSGARARNSRTGTIANMLCAVAILVAPSAPGMGRT